MTLLTCPDQAGLLISLLSIWVEEGRVYLWFPLNRTSPALSCSGLIALVVELVKNMQGSAADWLLCLIPSCSSTVSGFTCWPFPLTFPSFF